jgi:cytochrome c1
VTRWPLVALVLLLLAAGVGAVAFASGTADPDPVRVAGGDAEDGAEAIDELGCGTCHTIPGVDGADGASGPPLTRWSERAFVAGRLPNTPANLVRWIMAPQEIEPGTAMPDMGISDATARDIAAYLYTLGDRDRVDR